ncbi:hypothetical protein K2Z84_12935 [Candidatus Binatia bacterium]|nr:hypothetical protein [Candidatus Binatia bacterium]
MPMQHGRRALAYVAAIVLLAAAAFYNGYPLVFSDSGTYVDSSFGLEVPLDRPAAYGAFLAASHWKTTLWLPVLLQGAVVVFVLDVILAAVRTGARPGLAVLPIVALLAAGSALPWFTGQIMPDVFAGVLVLTLFLLLFCPDDLSAARRRLVGLLCVLSIAVHFSHILLAAALVVTAASWWAALRLARGGPPRPVRLGYATTCLGLSIVISVLFNLVRTGEPFLFSRVSHVFLTGRLVSNGLIQRLLDERCDGASYALCGLRDRLVADSDHYIWSPDSPIHALGGFLGSKEESRRLIHDVIVAYPGAVAASSLRAAVAQMATFRTGDGLGVYGDDTWIGRVVRRRFPSEAGAYFRSRQQQGTLWSDAQRVADVHQVIVWACLAASPALALLDRRRGRDRLARLHVFVWIALLENAAITGALSTVVDRYQARIVWLLTLAVLLSVDAAVREGAQRGVGTRLGLAVPHDRQPARSDDPLPGARAKRRDASSAEASATPPRSR